MEPLVKTHTASGPLSLIENALLGERDAINQTIAQIDKQENGCFLGKKVSEACEHKNIFALYLRAYALTYDSPAEGDLTKRAAMDGMAKEYLETIKENTPLLAELQPTPESLELWNASEQGKKHYIRCWASVTYYYLLHGPMKVEGDKDVALTWLLEAAEAGHPEAAHNLGQHYFERGNKQRAFEWFVKAAQRGDAEAAYVCCQMLRAGWEGRAQDEKAANVYYRNAAELGHAQVNYEFGVQAFSLAQKIVDEAEEEQTAKAILYKMAFQHFKTAAEKGHLPSVMNAALIVFNGFGVIQDKNLAMQLLSRLVAEGYVPALKSLEMALGAMKYMKDLPLLQGIQTLWGWELLLRSMEIKAPLDEENKKRISRMIGKLEGISEWMVGHLVWKQDDEHYDADLMKSVLDWLKEETSKDPANPKALSGLAELHIHGLAGYTHDYEKAIELFKRAGEAGYGEAYFHLGALYEVTGLTADSKGVLPKQDLQKAIEAYGKGAELGNGKCLVKMGLVYTHGQGVEPNTQIAKSYFVRASEYGWVPKKDAFTQMIQGRGAIQFGGDVANAA